MNKLFAIMTSLMLVLFASNSFAFTPPPSPAPTSWISDTSGVLSSAAHQRLDAKLRQINQSSANEVAALIVPSLGGEDISDVTNATFKSWGVGKKGLDNGVLVVLAMKEHKSRIETGKGVEGDLPDLKTQDILNNVLRPHMKKGDVEGALDSTFSAVSSSIENHKAEAEAAKTRASHTVTPVTPDAPLPTTSPSCDVSAVGSATPILGFLVILFFAAMLVLNRVAKNQEKARQAAELVARQKREKERQNRLAEQNRLAQERADDLAKSKLENERLALRAKAERDRIAIQQRAVPTVVHPKPVVHHEAPKRETVATAAVIVTAAAVAEQERARAETRRLAEREAAKREAERESANRREEERARARRREADEADARARRQREQDDEDRRRRDSESSSSSSYDSGSSSSSYDSGSSSSGSDFGGGDSGGGGSSSDW